MSRTQRRTPQGTARGRHGFSIVELLIALIIIGILTSVLVPTISHRAEESRLTACKADLEVIAAAEDRVASDTGYYVRLFALDDLAKGDGFAETYPLNRLTNPSDGVQDERLNVRVTAFNNSIFIRLATNAAPSVVPAIDAEAIYTGILGADLSALPSASNYAYARNWYGPYFAIKNQPKIIGGDYLHQIDIPSDPWGTNYVLFFNNGCVLEPDGAVVAVLGSTTAEKVFDRPTIVSFGPNGKPGDGTPLAVPGTGDDLFYTFGY